MLFRSANRRALLAAMDSVESGASAPGTADATKASSMHGPDTVDGIAPAADWAAWWQAQAQVKRDKAPWK